MYRKSTIDLHVPKWGESEAQGRTSATAVLKSSQATFRSTLVHSWSMGKTLYGSQLCSLGSCFHLLSHSPSVWKVSRLQLSNFLSLLPNSGIGGGVQRSLFIVSGFCPLSVQAGNVSSYLNLLKTLWVLKSTQSNKSYTDKSSRWDMLNLGWASAEEQLSCFS